MRAWSRLTPIASALDDIAQRFGLSVSLLEHKLQRHWPVIVGEHVAAHTRPESIRFKKLYVITDSSVWVQQLTFLKPSLLESINTAAGSPIVTDIVLRVGEVEHETPGDGSESPSRLTKIQPAHSLSPESLAEVSRHAEAVEDPDIRACRTEDRGRAPANPTDPHKSRLSVPRSLHERTRPLQACPSRLWLGQWVRSDPLLRIRPADSILSLLSQKLLAMMCPPVRQSGLPLHTGATYPVPPTPHA
jgi:hypothetical protein